MTMIRKYFLSEVENNLDDATLYVWGDDGEKAFLNCVFDYESILDLFDVIRDKAEEENHGARQYTTRMVVEEDEILIAFGECFGEELKFKFIPVKGEHYSKINSNNKKDE